MIDNKRVVCVWVKLFSVACRLKTSVCEYLYIFACLPLCNMLYINLKACFVKAFYMCEGFCAMINLVGFTSNYG